MANTNSTAPLPPPPPAAGTGPGPVGVPGGTDRSYRVDIIVCAVVTAVIGSVFVALRFYTRRVIVYVLGWEDWLILAAQIFSIAMCAGFVHEAILGHGQHSWLVPAENFFYIARAGWYTILFYELSLFCSQLSIMILYIRIWALPWVRRTAYGLLTLVIIYNLLAVIMVATACIPLSAFWDLSIKGAYCHVKNICVCALSIIRLYILKITADTMDYTFDNVPIAFWSCVETNATVVIACFMTMKPLLCKWFPNLTTPSESSRRLVQP